MAGSRGYSSYRGRTPRWKIVAAVVLILVLLASCAVLFLENYIVYGDDGAMRIQLPWMEEEQIAPPAESGAEQDDLEIIIPEKEPEPQTPEGPAQIRALQLSEGILEEDWNRAVEAVAASGENAWVVSVKLTGGRILYDSAVETAVACGAVKGTERSMAALEGLLAEEAYAIARLSCFHDSIYANANMDGAGLKNTGGYIFYDGNNTQWLDPGKEGARAYLLAIARECAAMGFDEILLTDVSYPTEGKLHKIAYGDGATSGHIESFLREMKTALAEYGVRLSVELPASVISEGADAAAGLELGKVAAQVDCIYAVTTAEEAPALAEKVAALDTDFVPELPDAAAKGSYVRMP